MNNKKAQTNQIFVYILSIFIVLFAGFIVTKFIFTFSSDVENKQDIDFLNDIKSDFQTVYTTYGKESVKKYKISSDVEFVCFASSNSCINELKLPELKNISDNVYENFNLTFNAGDNLAMFSEDSILFSENVGDLVVENDGCICINSSNNLINLVFENRKNTVYLNKID